MKKMTLIAAAAALLLSGGVFMKVNKMNANLLNSEIDASAFGWEDLTTIADAAYIIGSIAEEIYSEAPKWLEDGETHHPEYGYWCMRYVCKMKKCFWSDDCSIDAVKYERK
ncbi:MAG: hypothetical protein J6U04_12875 [Salinivirgaceae bacterium]|nr:hypothetical protein [Salinivirgaceae bacterium]